MLVRSRIDLFRKMYTRALTCTTSVRDLTRMTSHSQASAGKLARKTSAHSVREAEARQMIHTRSHRRHLCTTSAASMREAKAEAEASMLALLLVSTEFVGGSCQKASLVAMEAW